MRWTAACYNTCYIRACDAVATRQLLQVALKTTCETLLTFLPARPAAGGQCIPCYCCACIPCHCVPCHRTIAGAPAYLVIVEPVHMYIYMGAQEGAVFCLKLKCQQVPLLMDAC
jgi:hypothetical protein